MKYPSRWLSGQNIPNGNDYGHTIPLVAVQVVAKSSTATAGELKNKHMKYPLKISSHPDSYRNKPTGDDNF